MVAAVMLLPRTLFAQVADTLPVKHAVAGNAVAFEAGALRGISFDTSFHHVGSQRFTLYGVADAEQHVFVRADQERRVEALYWLQLEEYLPGRGGRYDYSGDSAITIQGLPLRANVAESAGPSRPGSDRDWMLNLLRARGLTIPGTMTRLRLIHLSDSTRRREVMVIYLEPSARLAGTANVTAEVIKRASRGMRLAR